MGDVLTGLQKIAPFKADSKLSSAHHTCGKCRFVLTQGGDAVCRRYPPQVTILLVPAPGGALRQPGAQAVMPQPITAYPIVWPTEQWCGEFQPVRNDG